MITKQIKKATKEMKIDNGMYAVGITAIYESFLESYSPIDEELTFWTVIYTGFYDMDSKEVAEMVSDTNLPEFFLASRKILGKKQMIKQYLEYYKMYKLAKSKTSLMDNLFNKLENTDFEKLIDELPESVREILNIKGQ